ncbi:MAG TPA: TolC family protein [bacterium]|nr:TolC family protein [bacterium]
MKVSIRVLLSAMLVVSFLPVSVVAQGSLDLASVRTQALAASASLRKAVLAYDSAALAEKAQSYKLLPSISTSAGSSLDYTGAGSLTDSLGATVKLSATQTIYDGGKQVALVRSGGVAVRVAAEAVRAARVAVVGQADAAFYDVQKAAASVDAAQADLDAATLRLGIAKAKAEVGIMAESDYLQAEAESAANQTLLTKAQKALASARARLASLTGLSALPELKPVDFSGYQGLLARLSGLDDTATNAFSKALFALAAAGNPALASYALETEKATIAVEAAKSAYAPTLAVGLSQSVGWGAVDGFYTGAGTVTLSGTLSLDPWNAANGVASARVAVESAALDGQDGARSLSLDIDVAVNGLESAARSIGSSAKALEYANSGYQRTLEKFRLSAASASDLSASEALVSADRNALIAARYDFLSSLSELRGLVGLESEDRIISSIP